MRRLLLTILALILVTMVFAQKDLTVEQYIDRYKEISIKEMEKSGIPASITLAQGILESRYGNSTLSLASNNHFGIKCHKGWSGKTYYHDDDKKNECFRVYKNPEQSFKDHTEFLQTRSRYEFLFEYDSAEYKKWAHGLKKAGYATNPKYGNILVDLIERHELYIYDRPGRNAVVLRPHEERNKQDQVETNDDFKMTESKVTVPAEAIEAGSISGEIAYNRIRAVVVSKYDNLFTIADRHGVTATRIEKYNDLMPRQELEEGMLLYLQPKRGRSTRQRTHVIQRDENMWDISQLYGVKLDKLIQRNLLEEGEEPVTGSVLSLNAKAKNKPSVRIVVPGQEEDAVPKEMVKTKQEVIVIEKPSTPEVKESTQELMIIPVEEDITEEAVENKVVIQEQPKVVQESEPDQIMIIPVMDADEILEKEDAVLETKPRQGEPGWRRIHEVK
ncbi:MAG: LysM peptidoglycan-binding domain-containing protein, partial [Bacteroidetes bacterium]|nr:LysM peptidoglycan-binding domain-containing protein [Bacteroidota bacterium]